MQTGMLWFDDSAKTLTEKVTQAAAYYQRKYHQRPNLCLVHPSALKGNPTPKIDDIEIAMGVNGSVLPDHFWLGQSEEGD